MKLKSLFLLLVISMNSYGKTVATSVCTPAIITSVYPSSGPAGTQVIITSNTSDLTGAKATINGKLCTIISSSSTQLVVTIPNLGVTGDLIVTNNTNCDSLPSAFTVINTVNNSCNSLTANATDLIIYEMYDEYFGNGGGITIYNGTGVIKTLSDYKIYRTNNYGSGYTNYATLSGTLAPGAIGIIKVTNSDCGPAATNGSISGGFNDGDGIQLRMNDGITIIDDVMTPATKGFYMKRNSNSLIPVPLFITSYWTTTSLTATGNINNCIPYGVLPTLPKTNSACKTTSISVVGIEGYGGGSVNPSDLNYQWYTNLPNTNTWTSLTDIGIYAGSTTATLTISDNSNLNNYQYYCEVKENTSSCSINSNATKINNTITWNGIDWRDSNNSIATPSLTISEIINADYNISSNQNLNACNLTINSGFTLTVQNLGFVTVQNNLTINDSAVMELKNQGSLIMINDSGIVTNNGTGKINVNKTSSPFKKFDYTYWSTPIASPTTNIATTFSNWRTDYAFYYEPTKFEDLVTITKGLQTATLPDGFDDNGDDWQMATTMNPGKGYIIMGPTSDSYTAVGANVTFTGKVNNGIIATPINLTPGIETNDDWNLVGNPYPSAISADAFIKSNIATTGTINKTINGTLYFWTHKSSIGGGLNLGPAAFNFSPDDYAVYTMAGGTGTSGTIAGSVEDLTNRPLGYIASGQAFFVEAASSGNVTFNNSMRSTLFSNTQFFKLKANKSKAITKDRIWLNLENNLGLFSQQLIGYFDETTLGFDNGYDGLLNDGGNYINFYSFIDSSAYKIQGRPTFDENDQVKLGYYSLLSGTYTIAIDSKEGVFDDSKTDVYLEDNLLKTIHNLKIEPYTFSTESGSFNDRFILRYKNETLGTTDLEKLENQVLVSNTKHQIKVDSFTEVFDKITVFDLSGKQLFKKENVNSNEVTISNLVANQRVLILKVTLKNGHTITKKIIY